MVWCGLTYCITVGAAASTSLPRVPHVIDDDEHHGNGAGRARAGSIITMNYKLVDLHVVHVQCHVDLSREVIRGDPKVWSQAFSKTLKSERL